MSEWVSEQSLTLLDIRVAVGYLTLAATAKSHPPSAFNISSKQQNLSTFSSSTRTANIQLLIFIIHNNWNSLDDRTVTSGSLNIFKNNLECLRSSQKMGLFVGIWCCLTHWGWAGPLVTPHPVSYRWVITEVGLPTVQLLHAKDVLISHKLPISFHHIVDVTTSDITPPFGRGNK